MNLLSILLTGSLITGSIGANALGLVNHKPIAGQTTESLQTISTIKAKEIALDETKGGLVSKSTIKEDNNIKKYEITIIKQNEKFDVEINAKTGKVLNFEQGKRNWDSLQSVSN